MKVSIVNTQITFKGKQIIESLATELGGEYVELVHAGARIVNAMQSGDLEKHFVVFTENEEAINLLGNLCQAIDSLEVCVRSYASVT